MKTYSVYIPLDAGMNVEVDAESIEDAIEKAHDEGLPSICYHCSKEIEIADYDHSATIDSRNVVLLSDDDDV